MPIVEHDPWRMQYFEGVDCPEEVFISTDDTDSYRLYPDYRWMYNKLLICDTQDIEAAPHGITPPQFPVFSKPIYNLRGMGTGSRIFRSADDYRRLQQPGHMWMRLLQGDHLSSDAAVLKGETRWWRHVTGKPLPKGMFDYWTVDARRRPGVEDYCAQWIRRNLPDYTGMINFETIGGRIIEAHLRFADQWPDLYGQGWVDCLVRLYTEQRWTFADENRRDGYSVVLFGVHGVQYSKCEQRVIDDLLAQPDISSIQITFHEDKPPEQHAMPPGGFRLAIVNCWDLEAGLKARERLALHFWSTQRLRPRKSRKDAK
ncbi:MAG TPA: hypothetical protein VLU25_10350 [Acidobacteriota bacterium]|nr:hypothetical protein [Acidobacteriota bacterium]